MYKLKIVICSIILSINLIMPFSALSAQNEIKILFSDTDFLSNEKPYQVKLYNYIEWSVGKKQNHKYIDDLLNEGWTLFQVVPINAKQHYWFFEK